MSANQRLGFHHWVASLKREVPSVSGVSNAPRSAASTAPPPQPHAPSVPAPRTSRDDDATRVHHIPKEIIHRMRERAASESPKPPQDERTCVFRAPPELLERAKRARASSEAPDDVLAAPSPSLLAEDDFGELPEAKSGVSLRLPDHPPTIKPVNAPPALEDAVVDVMEPLDNATEETEARTALDPNAQLPSHVDAPASVNETASDPLNEASLERLSDVPAFRQPLAGKFWLAALMVVVAVLVAWSTR